ncbi:MULTISPECIES: hypothetical protein [Rheinheimera]|uniref:hypothetical protein n=1 Tax=Rheinheimera TaxID=67575 RepID=UPI001047CD19|nr:hypothetical protein [Rheinheimera sp. D18]QBL09136.1 hypothetical protein E0Z06_06210 [Rheinheimera sp. D18]
MTKLDKDQVVADFTAAYKAAFGKAPKLEQKPGWFSVDGDKNIRLAELAELGASYSSAKAKAKPAAEKKAAAAKTTKTAAKPAAKAPKTKASGNGQVAAKVWIQHIGVGQRAPRGSR